MTKKNRQRPTITGSATIFGSFPPVGYHFSIGKPENYFIHDGYQHRTNELYDDDTELTDEWQREVYQFAAELSEREDLKTICDIGCGSAYKLIYYFRDRTTIGIDLLQTCKVLRKRWPDRCWIESDFSVLPPLPVDLVIASDVIEHLARPNDLMLYIARIRPKYIVISTPDRDLLRQGTYDGPPLNTRHIREWNYAEFHAYLGHLFEVRAHFISYAPQATQCALCKLRDSCGSGLV